MRQSRVVIAIFLALLLAPAVGLTRAAPTGRPNIVVIVADDLDAASFAYLDVIQSRIAEKGMTFPHMIFPTPSCCPARSSLLKGQYAHNHGVHKNTGRRGGFSAFADNNTLPKWLKAEGYRTALVGKYLNGYGDSGENTYVPPHWDRWVATFDRNYVNYNLNIDGRIKHFGSRARDYQTDVFAGYAARFIKRTPIDTPIFLYLTPRAPHGKYTPARRHAGTLPDATAPRSRSFNEENVTDKPTHIRTLPPITNKVIASIDKQYQARREMMLSTEDLVARVLAALEETDRLENTYVLFLTDHGYHQGEHRLVKTKGTPYEEAIRAPLFVRGPDIAPGSTNQRLVSMIDLAPTIADWAGATTPSWVDGRSFAPLVLDESPPWRDAVLLEVWSRTKFRGIRTEDWTYVEYQTGERELYDLRSDPEQLVNLAGTERSEETDLASRLTSLRVCAGDACRIADSP